jgi:GntR family transcriptional regulator
MAGRTKQSTALKHLVAGIDRTQPTPLYHQIFVQLRDRINEGAFADGSLLPGEQEISEIFQVSRITAKRALDEIAAAGLAVRQQGRGTLVRRTPEATSLRGTVENLALSLRRHSNVTTVRLHEFGYVPAPADAAGALGLAPGDEVQRVIRVWIGQNGPFSHLTTFVPVAIARGWSRADLEAKPLAVLIAEQGIKMSRAEESISATLAEGAIATRLELAPGAPLLAILRTLYDQHDRPIEHLSALYPPERYRYSISLSEGPARESA